MIVSFHEKIYKQNNKKKNIITHSSYAKILNYKIFVLCSMASNIFYSIVYK